MTSRAAAALSVAAFAVGVSTGFVGYHCLGPRPGHPAITTAPSRDEGAVLGAQGQDPPTGLYTDNEVRRVVERWTARRPNDDTLLRVVPSGSTAPLVTVFGALGLDLPRLGKPTEERVDFVLYLTWRVSPSYDLSCMTAAIDPDNERFGYTDPRRRLYGIRISKRIGR